MKTTDYKLFDSELKVMDILWREGDVTTKYIAQILAEELGWNKNTTYTLIKRCMKRARLNVLSLTLCVTRSFRRKPFRKRRPTS